MFEWSLSLVDYSVISKFHVRSGLAKEESCPLYTSDVMFSFWS